MHATGDIASPASARLGTGTFLLLLAAVAIFVVSTAQFLPSVVASHFSAAGAADGFMPREAYLVMMVLLGAGVPAVIGLLPGLALGKTGKGANLPNRDYWLAPERRAATLSFLRSHGRYFGAALAAFMGYVHWLVVQANRLHPPVLSTFGMVAGLAVFFAALAVWLAVLYLRFRVHG